MLLLSLCESESSGVEVEGVEGEEGESEVSASSLSSFFLEGRLEPDLEVLERVEGPRDDFEPFGDLTSSFRD